MNLNNNSTAEAKERKFLTLRKSKGLAITFVAIISCLAPTSTAFGYSYYSDEWMDYSDPNNIRIVGYGVTHDPDNGYMGTPQGYQQIHSYWVKITLTSPSSRTIIWNSNQSPSYTSVEVGLAMIDGDEFDLGSYSVQTQHWMCCPYMQPNPWNGQRCYPSATTAIDLTVGASLTILTKAAMSNTYTKIANCNVHCPEDQFISSQNMGQTIAGVVPWTYIFGGYACAPFALNFSAPYYTSCQDFQGRVPIPGIPF